MQELVREEKAIYLGVINHLHLKEQRDKIGSINCMMSAYLYYRTMGISEDRGQTYSSLCHSQLPVSGTKEDVDCWMIFLIDNSLGTYYVQSTVLGIFQYVVSFKFINTLK